MTAPPDIDGLLERLLGTEAIPAEQARVAIASGASLVKMLDDEQRDVVRRAWRSLGFRTLFVTPRNAVERLVALRPDLERELRSDLGRVWVRAELNALVDLSRG